jgi:hypothetical protein
MKRNRSTFGLILVGCLAAGAAGRAAESPDPGPFVRALWLVHRHGTAQAADPARDAKLKGTLAKAMGKDGVLTARGAEGLFDPETFSRLAGPDGRLDPEECRMALDADTPESRGRLIPQVAEHAAMLTTSFDLIDEPHREAGARLSGWIAENYHPGRPLDVIVICTGNSRRSILGSTMGNIASAYYGMPEVRFHSGGTDPTAFNPRTIAALRSIGVEIEPTGDEAPRGEPETTNPVYDVRWGRPGEPPMEAKEFSKTYFDAGNPRNGFAALMVCGEADAGCPVVKGASARISMPYLDPKVFDGSPYESVKYAERRDDIGRLLLSVMMQARNQLGRESGH